MSQSLDSTIGAVLMGSFVGVVLYGIGVHQAYRYARTYSKDTPFIRVLVLSVLTLETLQVAFSIHSCYDKLVKNYFLPSTLLQLVWSENLITVTGCLIIIASEIFFVRRVSMISYRYKIIASIALLFLAAKMASDIALAVKGFTSNSVISTYTNNLRMTIPPLVAVVLVNALMTGSLFACVRKSRANYLGKDSLLDLVTLYGINTGLLILIVDLVSLIMALTRKNDLYWVTLHLIGARLYMNTLLCVLNSRELLIARGVDIFEAGSYGANAIARANRNATVERWNVPQVPENEPPAMIDIKVTTEVEDEDALRSSSSKQGDPYEMARLPRKVYDSPV